MMKLLVADDDVLVRQLVEIITRDAGYDIVSACDGEEALQAFCEHHPNLVILDVMMPKHDGFEVCSRIRALDSRVPVIFLSAKGDVVDRKTGLRVGADDYLPKPFDEEELLLRIEALLRREHRSSEKSKDVPTDTFEAGPFTFDVRRICVAKDGEMLPLTQKEFQILLLLASKVGTVFSIPSIVSHVWGEEYQDEAISIPVYVRRIRNKIEDDPSRPRHLRTMRGSGYYFEE